MKLEIAAGDNPQTGASWLKHDFRNLPGIDIICDWRGLVMLADDVREIYCRHFLEHLSPDEGIEFLSICHLILRKGGKITIICPNMKWLCERYLNGVYADSSEFICWMYGGGDESDWSYHKAGYDCDLLCRALSTVGFKISSHSGEGFLLEVRGVKDFK